jgi:hypothetical protein
MEEQDVVAHLPYVSHDYILKRIQTTDITSVAQWLIELPLCQSQNLNSMVQALLRLKQRQSKLRKSRSKAAGKRAYEQFLNKKFVFPIKDDSLKERYKKTRNGQPLPGAKRSDFLFLLLFSKQSRRNQFST